MDALNKNVPVGQPDANGNYEWLTVRAGGGMDTTGDVEINDGDLDMGGGTIYNWTAFIPPPGGGGGGPPAPYWLSQPPCSVALQNSQLFATGGFDFFPDSLLSTPVNPSGPLPYADFDGVQYIRIYEPGLYECTVSLCCTWVQGNGSVRFVMGKLAPNKEMVRCTTNGDSQSQSPIGSPPIRQMISYFAITPTDFGVLPFVRVGGVLAFISVAPVSTVRMEGGKRHFMSVRKLSDNFTGAVAIPP